MAKIITILSRGKNNFLNDPPIPKRPIFNYTRMQIMLVPVFVFIAFALQAQLATWTFETNVTSAATTAAGITAQNAAFGSGVSNVGFVGGYAPTPVTAYTADNWTSSTSRDDNDYIEFKITAACLMDITGIQWDTRRSGTGPTNYEVRYSTDDFATSTSAGTGTMSGTSVIALSAAIAQPGISQISIRIYAYTSTGTTGTLRFDNVRINGTSTLHAAVTAPGTWTGNTTGAPTCPTEPFPGHNYQVTIPNSGVWIISLCGSSFDTWLVLGTNCCFGSIETNDDFCGLQSRITRTLAAGTYYVRVQGFSSSNFGEYGLNINRSCSLVLDQVSSTPETCPGDNNGSITVTSTGGTAPITYAISGPVNASNGTGVFGNLPPGNYNITVSDGVSCMETSTASVGAGQGDIQISCVQDVVQNVNPGACTWTSTAGSLTPTASSTCEAFTVSWEIDLPSTIETIAAWNFENAGKRVAPNLPYTADAGIAANVNTAPLGLAGGPAFSAWVNGAGGGGTFSPNTTGWSGAGDRYWQAVINTTGYSALQLSSKQQSSNTGPRDFVVEYSLNGSVWVAVPGSSITATPAATFSGVLANVSLPTACNNQATLYLRWRKTSETSANGATVAGTGTNRIDDILITGQAISGADITGINDASGTIFPVGISTVTYKITGQPSGQMQTCSFSVRVVDNIPPMVTCSSQTLIFNGQPSIPLVASQLATASDNCGTPTLALSPNNGVITCLQVGQTVPVTVTAKDASNNMSTCVSQITVTGLPCGWSHNSGAVGCGSTVAFAASTGLWTMNANNCYYANPYTSDALAFAQRQLCGNGSITARVTSIGGVGGWAGVTMRETNDAGAKKVQLMTNLSNFVRAEVRYTTGGQAYPADLFSFQRFWVRIMRQGNEFTGFVSSDGNLWIQTFSVLVPMNSCIQVGLVMTNFLQNGTGTATFDNVSTSGSNVPPLVGAGSIAEATPAAWIEQPYSFEVYPNPTSGEVNVDLTQYMGRAVRLEVYSLEGKLLQFTEIDEVQTTLERVDLSAYQNGMYLVRVKSAGTPDVTRRVILSGIHRP